MKEQKRATLPLMILLSAVMILIPVAAGSGGWHQDSSSSGGPAGAEEIPSLAAARAHPAEATPARSRAIFLLTLLLVTSAATADVLSGELIRRRTVGADGERLHAKLHEQVHERTMS